MLAWVLLIGCGPRDAADDLFTNVNLRVDGETTADAFAVRDGVVVGLDEEATDRAGRDTEQHDLGGATVVPGFQDAHVHLLAGAFAMERLLLLGTPSMNAMAESVERYAAEAPEEPWIVGYGWLSEQIEDPDKAPIDAVAPDRPVLLVSNSGHDAIVNSAGLAAAGIGMDTPDPQGGVIVRDPETGEPTGLLKETAVSLVSDAVLSAYDDAALSAALPGRLDEFSVSGITGVHEVLAVPGIDIGRPWIYADLEAAGELPLRVTWYGAVFSVEDLGAWQEAAAEYEGELVRFGGGKVWVDGSMGSAEAWVEEPFASGGVGSHYFEPDQLNAIVAEAEARGIPLKMHVNGDAAIDAALDALEAAAPLTRQHVLEHVVLPDADDYARMQVLGVVASVQPTHYVGARFGETAEELGERFDHAYPFRALVDGGIPIAMGTDWPVWPSQQPLLVSWSAVTGQADGNALTVAEALGGYSQGSATALGRQDELGRLDVGFLADFVVLGEDPFAVPVDGLPDVTVDQVWVNGRQVR